MRIDIEKILEAKKVLTDFNQLNIEDIVFYKDGFKININKKTLNDFIFTGLDNSTFITCEFYRW